MPYSKKQSEILSENEERNIPSDDRKNSSKIRFRKVRAIKALLFYAVLFLIAFIGLLFFLRPTTSDVEKRELTKFPSITFSGLADGTFAKGVDTWYADTYPLRELFMRGNEKIKSLYGNRSTQFVGKGEEADAIPESTEIASLDELNSAASEPEEILPDGTIKNAPVERSGSVYITQNKGYGMYYFAQSVATKYAAMVNKAYDVMGANANIYCMIAPLNSGIMLDKSIHEQFGASDQKSAIDYMYGCMNKNIKKVDAFTNVKKHNAEYVYFNTDHHWTAVGAYYAYREFAKLKGITPNELSSFETKQFDNFLGSYYSDSQSQELASNPDTVYAYVPKGTNDMTFVDRSGETNNWNIIYDVSDWASSSKYNCFCAGDNPSSVIHNPNITDQSACVVIKDSYGNALIPFLVDHYEYVYWLDFRYYGGSLPEFVRENNVKDVIYITDIYNTSTESMVDLMAEMLY